MAKTVLLYSGGLDSFIASQLLEPDVILYIKTGSVYQEKEIGFVLRFVRAFGLESRFRIADLSFLKDYELDNAHIPLRNLLFIQIASYYGDTVYLCALKGETSKDKSKKFRSMTQELINYCLDDKLALEMKKKIKVIFPFKKFTKTKLLKYYLDTAVDKYTRDLMVSNLEEYTISCYDPVYDACGWCMSCYRRWVAEINNDMIFREYNKSPYDYYKNIMSTQYKGIWEKYKVLYKKEFYVNIPSNIGAVKANRKFKRWRGDNIIV